MQGTYAADSVHHMLLLLQREERLQVVLSHAIHYPPEGAARKAALVDEYLHRRAPVGRVENERDGPAAIEAAHDAL